ncbi:MAG: hypothetical protein H6797_00825 [Candidatus Nomurabacteria bacterium]|nr:MAG: hypothetical protein H6797_00825 [Candidatus Nomurabacteria bacterium]
MFSVKEQINAILHKEMDRKEFLTHIAIGLVALIGLGSILRVLASHRPGGEAFNSETFGGTQDGK